MSKERRARCQVCRAEIEPRAENPAFPFCSERCKRIDLGKWLGEAYAIPGPPSWDPGDGRDPQGSEGD